MADPARQALAVLLSDALEPIVEMVARAVPGGYEALAPDGRVRFRRAAAGFEIEACEGRNPLEDQSVDRFAGIEAERANPFPTRTANAYPFAYEQIAQLFDDPDAPDLCVLHTAAHNWEDHGGHRGEHGSLGVVQQRAPLIVAGAGVVRREVIPAAARLVDIAPTILDLLSGPGPDGRDGVAGGLTRHDGRVLDGVADRDAQRPTTVVGFLLDGCNANVLADLAARGGAPNIARLMAMGTTFGHGAMASLPTVTLANHTTILTGVAPGHHGILHNAWLDRATGQQVITNSPATWPWAMQWLTPGTDSIHHAIHRHDPAAFTASVNEPCDPGADYSTFEFFRRGDVPEIAASPEGLPHVSERFVRPSKNYAWSSIVDAMAREQVCGLWTGEYRGERYPRATFMWVNFTLTDSAFHEGGPYSEIAAAAVADTDGRIGDIIDAIDAAGALDSTAFVLTADHGMEETNPAVTGDWDAALRAAGVTFRDEGYGFVYLG